jgi:DNA repair protein RadC
VFIFVPYSHYDEPKTLSYFMQPVCLLNADGGHPREIVKIALEVGAAGLIIAHNHPSGDPNPSRADIENTKHLMAACRGVQLVVHDHIVIAAEGWMSMRASGLI